MSRAAFVQPKTLEKYSCVCKLSQLGNNCSNIVPRQHLIQPDSLKGGGGAGGTLTFQNYSLPTQKILQLSEKPTEKFILNYPLTQGRI